MVAPLVAAFGVDERVLVGPDAADDAGVLRLGDSALVATVDFITPVCDDPPRFGRIAAANALSDVFAMGGRPLLALNVCCFPDGVPREVLSEILRGGAAAVREAGAVVLGGHSVRDDQLKYGLAVVGQADPDRLLTLAGALPGDRLVLTKPIGTGVLINAFRAGKLDAAGLEPALAQMERLNDRASALALEHGARAATDVTGFGLAGHALGLARASAVGLRLSIGSVPRYERFPGLVEQGVSTGSTAANRGDVERDLEDRAGLDAVARELLFDPQTSGGLLIAAPGESAPALLRGLLAEGHRAAEIGEVVAGPARIVVTS